MPHVYVTLAETAANEEKIKKTGIAEDATKQLFTYSQLII